MKSTTRSIPVHSPRRVIIVHGYRACPDDHWFPWLRDTLSADGVDVNVVTLPTPEEPDAAEWHSAVAEALGAPDASTWVVAHSLGAITALRVLASLSQPWTLGGLVLVSGFTGALAAIPELDAYLADDVDAEAIGQHISVRVVMRSDADSLVPPAASDALALRLGAELHIEPGAGHFLAADGVTTLRPVVDWMRAGVASAATASSRPRRLRESTHC
ncbi:RBBP9/YdeN family alpha/beta hydrolase [Rhodococcus artemisiae]|uniref:Alpha/beta hydrolase n=1 Tax=Rhodococcus artemisiae TaxID=714159 RepID=A0ABU7LGR5_9NOCA|nr:alpha/beta hydrolase [Rhodococcus artemisiae]MEE2060752.1 alpha/beta hydrolase [Rhodococcus artemisiae]